MAVIADSEEKLRNGVSTASCDVIFPKCESFNFNISVLSCIFEMVTKAYNSALK